MLAELHSINSENHRILYEFILQVLSHSSSSAQPSRKLPAVKTGQYLVDKRVTSLVMSFAVHCWEGGLGLISNPMLKWHLILVVDCIHCTALTLHKIIMCATEMCMYSTVPKFTCTVHVPTFSSSILLLKYIHVHVGNCTEPYPSSLQRMAEVNWQSPHQQYLPWLWALPTTLLGQIWTGTSRWQREKRKTQIREPIIMTTVSGGPLVLLLSLCNRSQCLFLVSALSLQCRLPRI